MQEHSPAWTTPPWLWASFQRRSPSPRLEFLFFAIIPIREIPSLYLISTKPSQLIPQGNGSRPALGTCMQSTPWQYGTGNPPRRPGGPCYWSQSDGARNDKGFWKKRGPPGTGEPQHELKCTELHLDGLCILVQADFGHMGRQGTSGDK